MVSLVTKVTSAWEGKSRRLEARESKCEEDCIRNIFCFQAESFLMPPFLFERSENVGFSEVTYEVDELESLGTVTV